MRGCLAAAILLCSFLLAGCNADEKQLLGRAEARWREGNYDDAIRLNTLLYERNRQGPYAAQALLNIGNIYYLNQRRIRDAITTYEKLIDALPGTTEERRAREQLAKIFENEIGDLTAAIAQYDKLLERTDLENRSEVQYLRANTHFKMDEFNQALLELRRLEAEGISGHLAHLVYLKIGAIYQIQHKYEDALICFQKVGDAPCPECRRHATLDTVKTYESLFDFDRAIEAMKKLDPSPENRKLIDQEIVRLAQKRKDLEGNSEPPLRAHR
jgi:tetratricopeptide (TPR) repeat protein